MTFPASPNAPGAASSPHLDSLAELTLRLLGVSAAFVSLTVTDEQSIVGSAGCSGADTSGKRAFADAVTSLGAVLVVPDATADPRFQLGPLGGNASSVRFCMGLPLRTPTGECVGSVCIFDPQTQTLRPDDETVLRRIAGLVVDHRQGLRHGHFLAAAHVEAAQQRQQLAAQEVHVERLASLSLLATGLAHEVNSPLASLQLNLESLRAELDDAQPDLPSGRAREWKTLLDELSDGANRIGQLVSGLQHHTRPDGPPAQAVSVRLLVERAQLLSGVHLQPGATAQVHVPEGLQVIGRETQLVQVLLNLMQNALQACNEAGLPLALDVRAEPTQHGVSLTLQDNGPGMDPDLLLRVKEPFVTTRHGGVATGLGLYVCEAIVKAHGGDFWLESAPGAGTTARMFLPSE